MNVALICFAIYVMSILIALRTMRQISPSIIVCGNALIVYVVALISIVICRWHIHFIAFTSLYWFLTLCLLMFFGAVYKSISLKMLLHLSKKESHTDSYETILNHYIKNQSYANRVDILLEKKLISPSSDASYSLTKKGNLLAKNISRLQRVFSIKESG